MQNLNRNDNDNIEELFFDGEDPFAKCEIIEVCEAWEDKVKRLKSDYKHEDLDTIVRFLKKVHPALDCEDKKTKYGNVGLELRIIDRCFKDKKGSVDRKSMVLYDFTPESIKKLKNWYGKNVKGNAVDMYYSVSNFFPNMKTFTSEGKPYTKNRINSQNASFSSVVVLDFDGISELENDFIDNQLVDLILPFDSIQTSLNGWQKVFYLKEPCWDKDIIPKFTKLFLSKGFAVDEAVNNKAQVARVLGSINNKAFSGVCGDRKDQFKVTRCKRVNSRVGVMELWDAISSLETVNRDIKIEKLNLDKPLSKEELQDKVTSDFHDKYGDILSSYWIKVLPVAIKKMYLDELNEGYTNDFMMFIIAHIKNTMKFTRDEFITLMDRWADLTGYVERDKYIYIWDKYGHKDKDGIPYKRGKYSSKLAQRYGAIDFESVKVEYKGVKQTMEDSSTLELANGNIVLNRKVTTGETFKTLTDGAMKVFICITVQKVLTNKDYVYSSEIIGHRLLSIKDRQTKEYLSELVKEGYLTVTTSFKGDGEQKYLVRKEYCSLTNTRNLVFNIHEAQRMLEQLKANEVKFYILLKSIATSGEVSSYGNNGLAALMGCSKDTIKRMKKQLSIKGFVGLDYQTSETFDIPTKYLIF